MTAVALDDASTPHAWRKGRVGRMGRLPWQTDEGARPALIVPRTRDAVPRSTGKRRWGIVAAVVVILALCAELALLHAAASPELGLRFAERADELEVTWVQPAGIAWDAGVRPGNAVTALNGRTVEVAAAAGNSRFAVMDSTSVASVDVLTASGGRVTASTAGFTPDASIPQQFAFLFIAASFLIVGGGVYVLAADRVEATVLFAFSVAAAASLVSAVGSLSIGVVAMAINHASIVSFGMTALLLFLVFPVNRLASRAGWWVVSVGVCLLCATLLSYTYALVVDSAVWPLARLTLLGSLAFDLLGAAALAIAALAERRARQEARRALTLIALGALGGLAPFIVAYVVPFALGFQPLLDPATSILSIFLVPASLGAAILSRQFLGIDRLVRRGIIALGVWLLLLAVYSLAISVLQRALVEWGATIGDLGVAAVVVIVAGGTFHPAQTRVRRLIERVCFRDIYDYSLTLRTLSVELVRLGGKGEAIATHTLQRLEQILDLSWGAVALSDGSPASVALPSVYRWGACPDGLDALDLLDAVQPPARASLLVRKNDALLPLVANEELVGVLAIGQKRRDVDLSPDDVLLLETLAPLLTTVFQNARHLSDLEAQVAKLAEGDDALRDSNTRLSRALVELHETQQHLVQQERLRAIGEMSAGIAHDFNNALTPIVGFSDFLLEDPSAMKDEMRLRRVLELIRTGATDAAGVVGRLREFYRPRDDAELLTRVDLPALAEQVIALTEPRWKDQAQARGVTVRLERALAPVPLIGGRATELREALTNLIFNAVDALPKDGTITIRTRVMPAQGGPAQSGGELVCVEVTDTGEGMTEEARRRCLEPFYTTKKERGTGLGLSLVYGTVQRHGGTMDVTSALGKGTTMRMSFPPAPVATVLGDRASDDAGTLASASAQMAQPTALRVLVVDDEPEIRSLLEVLLTSAGHTVDMAADGRTGLLLFDAGHHDLVITDMAMPLMNGEQVARGIKQASPTTPVILLTGYGDLMNARGEHPADMDAVISKPVTRARLAATMAAVVRGVHREGLGQGRY